VINISSIYNNFFRRHNNTEKSHYVSEAKYFLLQGQIFLIVYIFGIYISRCICVCFSLVIYDGGCVIFLANCVLQLVDSPEKKKQLAFHNVVSVLFLVLS
jgi:hypothetical protein